MQGWIIQTKGTKLLNSVRSRDSHMNCPGVYLTTIDFMDVKCVPYVLVAAWVHMLCIGSGLVQLDVCILSRKHVHLHPRPSGVLGRATKHHANKSVTLWTHPHQTNFPHQTIGETQLYSDLWPNCLALYQIRSTDCRSATTACRSNSLHGLHLVTDHCFIGKYSS